MLAAHIKKQFLSRTGHVLRSIGDGVDYLVQSVLHIVEGVSQFGQLIHASDRHIVLGKVPRRNGFGEPKRVQGCGRDAATGRQA